VLKISGSGIFMMSCESTIDEDKIDVVRAVHFLKKAKQDNENAAKEDKKGARFHLTLR